MALDPQVRQVIEEGHLAHVVTLNPDGSPQVSCVWVGVDGDDVVFASLADRQKLRNLRRDPRVAVSLEARGQTHGMANYLVLHGRATVERGGADELLARLADAYLGEGHTFSPPPAEDGGFVARIRVERVGGMGPWAQRPTRPT